MVILAHLGFIYLAVVMGEMNASMNGDIAKLNGSSVCQPAYYQKKRKQLPDHLDPPLVKTGVSPFRRAPVPKLSLASGTDTCS